MLNRGTSVGMTAQILLVFEIWRFLGFFQKIFKKTILFLKFDMPIFVVRAVRVLSGFQGLQVSLAFKSHCSNPCNFFEI